MIKKENENDSENENNFIFYNSEFRFYIDSNLPESFSNEGKIKREREREREKSGH